MTDTISLHQPALPVHHLLRELAEKDPGYHDLATSIADSLEHDGAVMTPKQAMIVLWRLKQRKIPHDATEFSVMLRAADDIMLAECEAYKIDTIWPALLDAQKTHIMALRARHEQRLGGDARCDATPTDYSSAAT